MRNETEIEKVCFENTEPNTETEELDNRNENDWAGPCADCETRSKFSECKCGCELIARCEPVLNWVETDTLHPDPLQPRKKFNEDSLRRLAGTLKGQGLLEPIVVDETGQIVLGERRWRAAKMAGLAKVLVIKQPITAEERFIRQLISDAHSEAINPIERAKAWQTLKEIRNLTYDELGELLGMNKSTIYRTLCLADMPKPMVKALEEERITAMDLAEIRSL